MSTTASELRDLYDYQYWANRRVFAAVETLAAEQFVKPAAGSYGSIRNTLVHMLSAEWGWLERCGGTPRGDKLSPDAYPTLAALTAKWDTVEGYMREFLLRIDDRALARNVEFAMPGKPARTLPCGNLLLHAALHSIHHRGQVSLLIRELGGVPPYVDRLIYDIENAGSASA